MVCYMLHQSWNFICISFTLPYAIAFNFLHYCFQSIYRNQNTIASDCYFFAVRGNINIKSCTSSIVWVFRLDRYRFSSVSQYPLRFSNFEVCQGSNYRTRNRIPCIEIDEIASSNTFIVAANWSLIDNMLYSAL